MKIISGKYKGRIIEGHDINGTRPTMDRVKESLFSTIQEYIYGSTILDLFSGSGNLAFESLSNGSIKAYIVDNNNKAINTIKRNIEKIKITDAEILNMDYKKALELLNERQIKLDIIFLDPPYKTNYIETSLKIIDNYNLLNDKGIIICESDSLDKIVYSNKYKEIKNKRYGDKYIVILEKI